MFDINTSISVAIPVELYDELKRIADRENRSLSYCVKLGVRMFVDNYIGKQGFSESLSRCENDEAIEMLMKVIGRFPGKKFSKSELIRKTQRLTQLSRDNGIKKLIDSGLIKEVALTDKSRGRPKTFYFATTE